MRIAELLKTKIDERTAHVKKLAPLKDKRDKLRDKMAPMEAELRELNRQVAELDKNQLYEIDSDIAGLQRALGAKSFTLNGASNGN